MFILTEEEMDFIHDWGCDVCSGGCMCYDCHDDDYREETAKAQLKKVVEIIQKNNHNFMLCGNYVDYGEMVVGADAWSQLKEEAGC